MLPHYLRPMLCPSSVALVGASERPSSMGRLVYESLLEAEFKGALHAVNPRHARVLGRPCLPSLRSIGGPLDLAVIVAPCAAIPKVLQDGAHAELKAAAVLSAPPADERESRRWQRDLLTTARKLSIRLLGPHAFGVMRTDIGLNATLAVAAARAGRLALVAQSSAVCTAMLDFARPNAMGFSTVVGIGRGIDVGFGDLLDALLLDPEIDGILLYVETVRDARRFVSALRAAARVKPVVVLKAGRSLERPPPSAPGMEPPAQDDVFDAAMRRSGTVRARTYTQLFAAARMLAMSGRAQGERLAIVTNGHGPGTLAADVARDSGVPLATLTAATRTRLAEVVPPNVSLHNPVNVRGDADPARFAAAVQITLDDPHVDAVLALHVRRPLAGEAAAAAAVAAVARAAQKPVLGAWLGAVDRVEVREALQSGDVPNFYTPENAVEAFAYLAAFRRHRRWLLEVPPPQPEPEGADLASVERIRRDAAAAQRTVLTRVEVQSLLRAFKLPAPPMEAADTLQDVLAAARRVGYPVRLSLDVRHAHIGEHEIARGGLRNGRMLSRAYGELFAAVPQRRQARHLLVQHDVVIEHPWEIAIGVHADPVFGPAIVFGDSTVGAYVQHAREVLLPPLNRRLVLEMLGARAPSRTPRASIDPPEALVRLLLGVSALACAVPWIRALVLDPARVGSTGAVIANAAAVVDPRRAVAQNGYPHMAIHPYPVELVHDVVLRDGACVHVRPIMPEDAELERAFVHGLSEQTRYYRFFYRLHEISPAMLARFTQIDYDRELALVALVGGPEKPAFVAVARFVTNPDRESAEYAIVVADAWQGRGLGGVLMERLIACARKRGLQRLEGAVLRNNTRMLTFVRRLGFSVSNDRDDPEQVQTVLPLR